MVEFLDIADIAQLGHPLQQRLHGDPVALDRDRRRRHFDFEGLGEGRRQPRFGIQMVCDDILELIVISLVLLGDAGRRRPGGRKTADRCVFRRAAGDIDRALMLARRLRALGHARMQFPRRIRARPLEASVENVSSSEAQVSNTTGDGRDLKAGAANSVNSRQMNASEFSVVPSTAPAFAGTTTAPCAEAGADPVQAMVSPAMIAQANLVTAFPPDHGPTPVPRQRDRLTPFRVCALQRSMIACYMGEVMSEHRKRPTSLRDRCEPVRSGGGRRGRAVSRAPIARAISPEAAVKVAREVAVWGTAS